MNIKLQFQKVNLLTAANYLSLVEICEENIKLGNEVEDYILRKNEYINKYAELMVGIVADAIEIAKVDFINEE